MEEDGLQLGRGVREVERLRGQWGNIAEQRRLAGVDLQDKFDEVKELKEKVLMEVLMLVVFSRGT